MGEPGEKGDPSPQYLGKTKIPDSGNTGSVDIIESSIKTTSRQANKSDYVAYVGTATQGLWVSGLCLRWNGESWEQIKINLDGNFESNPYILALSDLTNNEPTETFLNLLVQNLIAKTIMVNTLWADLAFFNKLVTSNITLQNPG